MLAKSPHWYTELDAIVYLRSVLPQDRFRQAVGIGILANVTLAGIAAAQATSRGTVAERRVAVVALSAPVRDSLRAAIRRLVDSAALTSLTVGISVNGRTVWTEGFGYADLAGRVPATPDTRYSLASISKPMTATAIMRLVEQGRLRLDAPANLYLRGSKVTSLAGNADSATVARLLSHTAGLPLHYRFYYMGENGQGGDGLPDVSATINRYALVVYPPGTVYSYSNLGYGILGEIVAAASGLSYEAYMRDQVFAPLGMTQTTIGTGAGLANSARRYDATARAIPPYDFDHRGASAVYSTANDMLRFAEFHLGTRRAAAGHFLADSTVRRMQQIATPHPTPPATPPAATSSTTPATTPATIPVTILATTPAGYGLGWSIDDDNGVQRVRHTGGMPGVNTVLALYPDAGVAVVALANQSSPLPGRVASDLAAAVMPAYAKVRTARRAAADSARRREAAALAVVPAAFTAPAEVRGTWRGTVKLYDRSIPIVLFVGESDVRAKVGEQPGLWTLVNDATYQNSLLGGRFLGTIPTDDAGRAPHVIAMSLRLHDGTLRGWLAAQVTARTNNFSLSSYADLRKDPPAVAP